MVVGARRSDMEIMRDILKMDREGIGQLRSDVNLNYSQVRRYLACLEQWDLIALERRNTQVTSLRVTGKGRRVLALLDRLFEILETDDEPAAGLPAARRTGPKKIDLT